MKTMACLLALWCVLSCGKSTDVVQTAPQPLRPITYDRSVPAQHKDILEHDLHTLETLRFPNKNAALEAMLQSHGELTGQALHLWLRTRVHYIVGEQFDRRSRIGVQQDPFDYAPTIVSRAHPAFPAASFADRAESVPVFVNLGAGIYGTEKVRRRLMYVRVAGTKVLVTSPRVGLLQIREGLLKDAMLANKTDLKAYANTAARLAVLFHEARHSDGHGPHAGFQHVVCPSGRYAGLQMCDAAANGPNGIETELLNLFIENCAECSLSEIGHLHHLRYDRKIRILPGAPRVDDRPEQVQFFSR